MQSKKTSFPVELYFFIQQNKNQVNSKAACEK